MSYSKYVISKGILGLITNAGKFGWSFGTPEKPASEADYNDCAVKIKMTLDPLNEAAEKLAGLEKYHYWLGEPDRDEMFYHRTFFCGSRLRLLVRGLKTDCPELIVNKNYLKYIRFRFNNLHSPGYHLTDIVCALLLRKGYSPLHCSGFSVEDSTVAVVAPPDTGKTLTTMISVLHSGASFISEDLGITDGQDFHACPWTSTFRYYDELSMSWILRMRMKIIKFFPPAELIPVPGDSRKINSYIEDHRIVTNKKITHLAILARRPGGIEILDKDQAKQMLLNLNRYEFVYMKNPLLTAYSYFNPEFDVRALVEKEKEILTKLVKNSTCLLVKSVDPTKFSKLIIDYLKQ